MFLLQLRNELWKLFGKKRTYIGLGAFILIQPGMLLMFNLVDARKGLERVLAVNGYLAEQYISALTVAVIMLVPQVFLLMPLYATLVGGDMVAKEAEDGTLRMILSRPVSRLRLLLLKWIAGVIFCIVLVGVLGGTAVLCARMWFPWQGMFAYVPGMVFNVLEPGEGLTRYLLAHVFFAVNATVMFTLAFLFSCFNIKPAAATVLALTYLFINVVMDNIPFFDSYEHWFLLFHFRSWTRVFADPIPWWQIAQSQCVLLGMVVTAFVIGATAFQLRDIKS